MVRIEPVACPGAQREAFRVSTLRVVIADDHVLVRAGIRSLLERDDRVKVVGECDDGLQALAMIGEQRPDLLLADITMRGLNGLETAAAIADQFPEVKVIILSMHRNEEYVIQALRAGCAGYLVKDAAASELGLALDAVRRGEMYLSPSISRQVVDGYLARSGAAVRSDRDPLTPRQRAVLRLIAEGKSTKQIAATLDLSVKTVETHRAKLMERLDIHDVQGLVKYAMRQGLIPPEG